VAIGHIRRLGLTNLEFGAVGDDRVNSNLWRIKEWGAPFGHALTFFALTVQVLLPLIVGLEISYADRLGIDTATICSAAIDGTPHGGNSPRPTHHDLSDGCPLCSALTTTQPFTAPAVDDIAPAAASKPITFAAAAELPRTAAHIAAYRARAPPSLI
jgi:hypothetical protein